MKVIFNIIISMDERLPRTLPACRFEWPAAPHDPSERELVEHLSGWEVRLFGPHDPRHAYLLRRGMGHLQFWHPVAGVSFLSPSALSGGRWELDVPGAPRRRFRLGSLDDVDDVLCAGRLPLTPDPESLLAADRRHLLSLKQNALLLGRLGLDSLEVPQA